MIRVEFPDPDDALELLQAALDTAVILSVAINEDEQVNRDLRFAIADVADQCAAARDIVLHYREESP